MEEKRDCGRDRGNNFTETEKNLLIATYNCKNIIHIIVDTYNIIENKQSDAVRLGQKNLAWQQIAKELKAQNQTPASRLWLTSSSTLSSSINSKSSPSSFSLTAILGNTAVATMIVSKLVNFVRNPIDKHGNLLFNAPKQRSMQFLVVL